MYHQGKIKKSIKTKVVFQVTLLIAVILIFGMSYITYTNISHLQKKALQDLQSETHKLAYDVEKKIEYLQESTELFSTNELLVNAFIDHQDKDAYLLPLVNNFKRRKDLDNLSLVDYDARVIFQTDGKAPNFEDSKELRLALSLAQTVTYYKKKTNSLVFIVPIQYYNTTQGAVVASFSIQKIFERHDIITDSIYTKFKVGSHNCYSRNYSDTIEYYTYTLMGKKDFDVFKDLNLVVEMGIAKELYYRPLYEQTLFLLFIGFIILFIGGFIAYLLATTITKPVLKLYEKVNTITKQGVITPYTPLDTQDELEVLGYKFYTKAKELDDLNKNLNLKVQEATKELEVEKNRFLLAIEGSQDGLWDWNLETDAMFFSDRFEIMLGYNPGELPKNIHAWLDLLHPDDKEQAEKKVKEYLESKGKMVYDSSFRLRTKDGLWGWFLGRGKAEFDAGGKPLRFVGFITDITQQKEYQEQLDHTAKHDTLTNLPNRFLLSELLTHAMHSVKRSKKHLAILFIDLDGFKEINDTHGHDAGDKVLTVVASRMEHIIRESDIVARIGGDEFVIVFNDLDNTNEIIPMLQRLLSDLSLDIIDKDTTMKVSASIGVSFYPQENDIGNEALLRQADQAMYIAKSSGKNQYQFFNTDSSDKLKDYQKNISDLHEAIKDNQFVLYYQPKVSLKTNKVIGFEALLRWEHPSKGILYPDSFLPFVKEDQSFMLELGKWVFENAFMQLQSWYDQGLDFTLSINVSSYEIQKQNFATFLKQLFLKYPDVEPQKIEIELLETAAFDNFEQTSDTLRACQELGVSIAIDDFGTGYASLHYLKALPMDTIKIDKSFVMDLLYTKTSLSIIEASLGLAHAFNTYVVAEGVETEEHGKILLQLGCEVAQGYAISKAIPADQVVEWIASYKGYDSWTKVQPITDHARIILYASIEHRNWIYSVKRFLSHKTTELPKLNQKECYLGSWLHSDVAQKYRDNSAFKELNTLHEQLHTDANELLLSSDDDSTAGIQKLENLQKEILKQLELLGKN